MARTEGARRRGKKERMEPNLPAKRKHCTSCLASKGYGKNKKSV